MTLIYIGFGLMTSVAVFAALSCLRLEKALRETRSRLRWLEADEIDRSVAFTHKALVRELSFPLPHFAVYRKGISENHDIIRIAYDPSDPDDREYKRIHAEEVAATLNYRP